MALRPGIGRVAAAGMFSLAALASASCTEMPNPTTTAQSPDQQLGALVHFLDCDASYNLYDDVYHEAHMRGTICVGGDKSITQVRVYDSPAAAVVALQDWAIDPDAQWLLQEENWFALGPVDQITTLSHLAQVEGQPTQELPQLPDGYRASPLDECIQFVSSTANAFLTDRESFSADSAALEKILPGVVAQIETLMAEQTATVLQTTGPTDLAFESEFSRLGPDIKAFCRDSQPSDQ